MAKPLGCFQRGSVWYIRILVPPALVETLGRSRVVVSLGTSDRKEAYRLATLRRAEWEADFAAKEAALNATPAEVITPEMGALLADLVRAQVLADDDRVRHDVGLLAEMVHMRAEHKRLTRNRLLIPQWDLPEPRIDDLSGATEEELRELADLNAYLDGKAALALAAMRWGCWRPPRTLWTPRPPLTGIRPCGLCNPASPLGAPLVASS